MKKPQRGLEWLKPILKNAKLFKTDKVVLIGLRGYFRDSMGVKGKNDRGIYDDAFFWVELETGIVHQYNGNTDPSAYRKGKGFGSGKGMASLVPGTWRYQIGLHRGYAAFRQAAPVTVMRDGTPDYPETGWFGINIHSGSARGTSSLGCQTTPNTQWKEFQLLGYRLLKAAGQSSNFPYVLVEQQG
jgi:lysozyme